MQLNNLQPKTKNRREKRVARGGKRGKTAGRGTKGQKARAGHRIRPEARDIIKKLPKLRGHGKNRARTVHDSRVKPVVINLRALESRFEGGETVSPETLLSKGMISRRGGKIPTVKILGAGELSKKLMVTGCTLSGSARVAFEKAGGSVAA